MLNFLKKIFGRERVLGTEEVKAEELESWLANKLSQIEFREEITDFFNELKDKKWLLGEKIRLLEEAEISEEEKEKVGEKVKSVVLGHKESYLKEMGRFIEKLAVPEEIEAKAAIRFNEALNKELDELAQKTAKSYQATQHLFFNQVEEVFGAVGEINQQVKDFDKKLEKKGLKKIGEMEEKIKLLREEKKKKERLGEELKWQEEKLKRSEGGKEKHTKEGQQLRESEEYQELKAWKEEEERIKKQVEEAEKEVSVFFSQLARALRKYEKVTLEVKIVHSYLEDASGAFFSDPELKIIGVLEGLERSIEKGEVALDDKEKETVKGLIRKGRGGYLKGRWEENEKLEKEQERMEMKLRRYTIGRRIEEAEYKREHFEEQTVLAQREMEELKAKLAALAESRKEEELKELVKEVLRVEVKLV